VSADLRVVLDTNVILSALLLRRSIPRQAFDHALACGVVLVSDETAEELNDVLRRPKFEAYVREEERIEFLTAFLREATLIEVTEPVKVCRDPRDDKFLALAVNGKATHIVTGDTDLLALHSFRRVPILAPARFIEATLDSSAT
jgi:putative PIN family toxin of toxin-antitoxin system